MIAPTAEEIQAASKLNFAELGYTEDAEVEVIVAAANALLTAMTGLTFGDNSIPTEQEPLVRLAVRGLSEQLAYQGTPEYLETLSDFDLIKSFNAGPYSETRRDATDAMKARMLNAWPWLNHLLWSILTDDKRDYWLDFFDDENAPAFAVSEVEWGDTGFPESAGGYFGGA